MSVSPGFWVEGRFGREDLGISSNDKNITRGSLNLCLESGMVCSVIIGSQR